jgi:hypothetical protein
VAVVNLVLDFDQISDAHVACVACGALRLFDWCEVRLPTSTQLSNGKYKDDALQHTVIEMITRDMNKRSTS